jgi:branched-subunit amino acid ABC-type transport system permease component
LGDIRVAILVSALIIGGFLGTIYGLMAFGMVASYRISRVVNLGQAGVAAVAASVYWWMTSQWGAPVLVCLVVSVLLAAVIGAFMGWINMLMSEVPKGIVMIFTLCITLLLFAFCDQILPGTAPAPVSPFGDGGFDLALTFVAAHQIGTVAVSFAAVVGATLLLRCTRFGLYVRAIYDDPQSAATLGIPLAVYVIGVWAMAGGMAGLAGILIANRTLLDTILLLFVCVWGLAGAILGGLESFALAFAGGMLLGVSEGVLGGMYSRYLPPGTENLAAVLIMAVAVMYAGTKRRHLAHLQT